MKKSVSYGMLEEWGACDSSGCRLCRVQSEDSLCSMAAGRPGSGSKRSHDLVRGEGCPHGGGRRRMSGSSEETGSDDDDDSASKRARDYASSNEASSNGSDTLPLDFNRRIFEGQWLASTSSSAMVPGAAYGAGSCRLIPCGGVQASASSSVISDIAFSADSNIFATAGVSKDIVVMRLDYESLVGHAGMGRGGAEDMDCGGGGGVGDGGGGIFTKASEMRMSSKLSSLAWSKFNLNLMACGDYDGVMLQIDAETGHWIVEADEHDGRRIWSTRFSPLIAGLAATAGDSGTVKLWMGTTSDRPVMALAPHASCPVTCVDFSPDDPARIAASSVDGRVYVYDLRAAAAPLYVLAGGGDTRPSSYVRWNGQDKLVSSSTDNAVREWALPRGGAAGPPRRGHHVDPPPVGSLSWEAPGRTAQRQVRFCPLKVGPSHVHVGHTNARRFVGLGISPSGLIATGDEAGGLFCYHSSAQGPVAVLPGSGAGDFPTSVAWRPGGEAGEPEVLLSATSGGAVSALRVERRA